MIKVVLDDQTYSFIFYYAPNKGQLTLFQSMLLTLVSMLKGTVIFSGDSNIMFDQGLDRSCHAGKHLTRPSKQSLQIAKFTNMVWLMPGEKYPTLRDYTHYSSPHNSFARIDHIFIATATVPLASKYYIRDSTWSDHVMVFLTATSLGS